MRRLALLITVVWAVFGYSSTLWAYTLTFDDIPLGKDLSYYEQQHMMEFALGWEVANYSGSNVLKWDGNPVFGAAFGFGLDGVPDKEYSARLVGAYFTTEPGIVIRMIGYNLGGSEVASVTVGADGESWHNRYAEIFSATGEIDFVHIVGAKSASERYHFSMDDLTIEPVPEPSSFAALGAGLLPVGAFLMRKRRRAV